MKRRKTIMTIFIIVLIITGGYILTNQRVNTPNSEQQNIYLDLKIKEVIKDYDIGNIPTDQMTKLEVHLKRLNYNSIEFLLINPLDQYPDLEEFIANIYRDDISTVDYTAKTAGDTYSTDQEGVYVQDITGIFKLTYKDGTSKEEYINWRFILQEKMISEKYAGILAIIDLDD